ncbi:hypothetical protein BDZ89DRAFT_1065653 [Hymenopellis radicata]|nr:hypothetical protein BDZ89DRAFT_1065653 [Hymenopellis radicata]
MAMMMIILCAASFHSSSSLHLVGSMFRATLVSPIRLCSREASLVSFCIFIPSDSCSAHLKHGYADFDLRPTVAPQSIAPEPLELEIKMSRTTVVCAARYTQPQLPVGALS